MGFEMKDGGRERRIKMKDKDRGRAHELRKSIIEESLSTDLGHRVRQ